MKSTGRDLHQRFEHEPTLVHPRVRDRQTRPIDHQLIIKQNVEIQGPGLQQPVVEVAGLATATGCLLGSLSAPTAAPLDLQAQLQQPLWRRRVGHFSDAIQKPRQVRVADRLGQIDRRNRADTDPGGGKLTQPL